MQQTFVRCAATAGMVFLVTVNGCSDRGKLTTEAAQRAINQFAGGTAMVSGIQELPQENSAKADVQFSQFRFPFKDPMLGNTTTQTYSGPGVAAFTHYNDGRWVLSQLNLSNPSSWGPVHWDNLSIVAVGEGAQASNQPSGGEDAVVRRATAAFKFQVDPQKQYSWCSSTKGWGPARYIWAVDVIGAESFNFGFTLFAEAPGSPAAGKCETGDLQKLLSQGQFAAYRKTPDGMFSIIDGVTVGHEIGDRGKELTITLPDETATQLVFSSKPKQVFLKSKIADENTSKPVDVVYR